MPLLAVKKLCTYIEYYSAIKMNEKLIHTATWINLQGIMPNEKNNNPKRYIVYDSTFLFI